MASAFRACHLRVARLCRRAISLVELLAIMAVLAVLTALLFPSAYKMIVRAESAGCVGKLKELHRLLNTYAADHNGYMPPAQNELDASRTWSGYLQQKGYLPSISKTANPRSLAAFCPGSAVRDAQGRADIIYGNYGMNTHVGGRIRTLASRTREPRPVHSFEYPSRTMLLADAGCWMLYPQVATATGGLPSIYLPGLPINGSISWADRFRKDAIEGRHGGVINAVMLDGHVKPIRADKLQVSDFWEEEP